MSSLDQAQLPMKSIRLILGGKQYGCGTDPLYPTRRRNETRIF